MNKLVSKNLIQRFKEGRKIQKMEWAGKINTSKTEPGTKVGKYTRKANRLNGPLQWYDENNNPITNRVQLQYQGYNYSLNPNGTYSRGKLNKITTSIDNPLLEDSMKKYEEFSAERQAKEIAKANAEYDAQMNKEKPSLINNRWVHGIKKRDEITDVRATQQMLKDAGFNIGKFGVDGKWGRDTEAAYQKYLIANAAKTPSLEDTISAAQNQPILSTPTINPSEYTFTESQLSGLGENPYYEPHPELRFNNFDRTQTRQWLGDNGFNPYSLTGTQRKALRMILNGQGTEQDKNLIGLTNGLFEILTNYKYLKQGGTMNILPSRNIVERFKQRNFR